MAASFIALAYHPVLYSHFGIISTTMACLTLLSFYFATRMYQTGRLKYYVGASIIGGLAIAAKYNAAIIIFPLLLAHLFLFLKNDYKFNRKFYSRAIIVILFVIIGFFIGCPYSLLDFEKFTEDISWLAESQQGLREDTFRYFKGIQSTSWALNFKYLWEGIGPFLLMFSLAGIFLSLFKRKYSYLLLLSFPLCYYVLISQTKTPVPRYTIALYPFLLLLASIFILFLKNYFHSFPNAFLIGIIIVALSIPFFNAMKLDYYFCQKDTRQLALEWIKENIPKNSKIAYEFFGPDISLLEGVVPYATHIEFYLMINKRCKLIKKFTKNQIFVLNPTIWVYKFLY